jgi:hypothetical protein
MSYIFASDPNIHIYDEQFLAVSVGYEYKLCDNFFILDLKNHILPAVLTFQRKPYNFTCTSNETKNVTLVLYLYFHY